jgi:hypothetical protein
MTLRPGRLRQEPGRLQQADLANHVAIVIHDYRWRQDLAETEPQYDDLEMQLAASPSIGVPTITLEGDANGAPHAAPRTYAGKFAGKYEHRDLTGTSPC